MCQHLAEEIVYDPSTSVPSRAGPYRYRELEPASSALHLRGWPSLPVSANALLFRLRFWRDHSIDSVIDHELTVVLAGVFDHSVHKIYEPKQLRRTVIHGLVQTPIAGGLDEVGSISDTLRDECLNIALRYPLIRWRIIVISCFPPQRHVRKEIHGPGSVQQLLDERTRFRIRFV